jgi:hypothetical protein
MEMVFINIMTALYIEVNLKIIKGKDKVQYLILMVIDMMGHGLMT